MTLNTPPITFRKLLLVHNCPFSACQTIPRGNEKISSEECRSKRSFAISLVEASTNPRAMHRNGLPSMQRQLTYYVLT